MAREPKTASAQEVRDWARSQGYDVGDRGRFSTEIVSEFNKAHRRNNVAYQGGTGQAPSGNSTRTPATSTRPARNASDTRTTRQAPTTASRSTETAPVTRQRRSQSSGDVAAAMVLPAGTGLSDAQVEQFGRMLADVNAVTGYQNELTLVRIAPAAAVA